MTGSTLYRRLMRYVRPYWWMFAVSVIGMAAVAAGDIGEAQHVAAVQPHGATGHRHLAQGEGHAVAAGAAAHHHHAGFGRAQRGEAVLDPQRRPQALQRRRLGLGQDGHPAPALFGSAHHRWNNLLLICLVIRMFRS